MPVKCEQYNQVSVIAIQGDLAGENAATLRKSIEEQIDQQHIAEFVIDLEKCQFVDSEGLETLLWTRKRCEEIFGQVKLANLDENCRKILEMTRLTHRFECHTDLLAAVKTMR